MANCSSTSTYAYILVQVSDGRQALSIPHTKDRKGQQDSSESASDNQNLLLLQDAIALREGDDPLLTVPWMVPSGLVCCN